MASLGVWIVGCWLTLDGLGQAPTTVQLPTFQSFSTSTSVLVPDRGGAALGGRRGVSWGSTAYGPSYLTPWRTTSSGASAGGMSITATIHDLAEMDAAVLAQTAKTSSPATNSASSPPATTSTAQAAPTGSLAAIRAQRAQALAEQDRAARELIALAQSAEVERKYGVARVYYRQARLKASEPLRQEIDRHLIALPSSSTPSVATRP